MKEWVFMRTFGEAFALIIKKRQMSVSAAAAELGFSSKTALFRIINDESKPSSIRKCLDAAIQCKALSLNAQEIMELETALRVSAVGKRAYMINAILGSILRPSKRIPEDIKIAGNTRCTSLTAFFSMLAARQYESISIGVFGNCPENIFTMLSAFSKEAPVKIICHAFMLDDDRPEDLHVFSQISSILFSPVYKPFILDMTKDSCIWAFQSGCVMFTCLDKNGGKTDYQMLPFIDGMYHITEDPSGQLADFWSQIAHSMPSSFRKVKLDAQSNYPDFPDNYVEFTRFYEKLEHNREIYTVRPDLPFFCISPDILKPMIMNGFAQSGMGAAAEPLVSELYEIQKNRFDNLFKKKKDTHIILSRTSMRRFAKTGVRSDHFFVGRPYTPQERVQILLHVLQQMKSNPYFHVWFSRDPAYIVDKEVTAYDGFGMAIVKGDTSWELDKDHQEILLENKLLASSFKEHMLAEIIPCEALSRTRSISMMEQLIALAAKSE